MKDSIVDIPVGWLLCAVALAKQYRTYNRLWEPCVPGSYHRAYYGRKRRYWLKRFDAVMQDCIERAGRSATEVL